MKYNKKKSKYLLLSCRICNSKKLSKFLDLGTMPIPNGFLTKADLKKKEPHYPLAVCVCEECWLVQLTHVIPPDIMFKNYLYIPSTSTTMLEHFKAMAASLIKQYNLGKTDLVIDIGSNDGTLLGFFKEQEIPVLGVDPASNLAQVARLKGIDTIDDFFTTFLARKIQKEKGKARLIVATNVFAHIHDLHDVCEAIKILLDKNGVLVLEFPYLIDLMDKNEFDTIYHEHLSYFSIRPLEHLFKLHEMRIIDIKRSPIHGGSVRVYAALMKSPFKPTKAVKELMLNESLRKLDKRSTYKDFARRVKVIRRDLVNYLKRLVKQRKRVVAYGASAKCNVLMNYCKIDTSLIEYIVDSIPYKQGRYTPGTHIRIYPEYKLENDKPDYALLTAWNFADEILQKQVNYRAQGGQFIITIPYLRIE